MPREKFDVRARLDGGALRWSATEKTYGPLGEPFTEEAYELDRSPATLALADEVEAWHDTVATWPHDAETQLYLDIARTVKNRLRACDSELKQDDPAEISALRYEGKLVTLLDHHFRRKTRVRTIHYLLSSPDSQRPRDQRPEGTIGGGGSAAIASIVARAEAENSRAVSIQAMNLHLYLRAYGLGFEPVALQVPRPPAI